MVQALNVELLHLPGVGAPDEPVVHPVDFHVAVDGDVLQEFI